MSRRDLCLTMTISIHAPHTRSDERGSQHDHGRDDFNPRPSYEERLVQRKQKDADMDFNPRPSYEERRQASRKIWQAFTFQSTPLIRGATILRPGPKFLYTNFNPRPSYEERLAPVPLSVAAARNFNPRPSYEERPGCVRSFWSKGYFNPRPSYEERRQSSYFGPLHGFDFNPRPSYEERLLGAMLTIILGISIHAPHTRSDLLDSVRCRASL
ncbi:MAG: hypothetical protein ACFWT1_03365 [Selenomonas sp.]